MRTHAVKARRQTGLRGLTLVECIAVIALVVAMTALLTPVTKKMIERSHQAACAQNLRNIMAAEASYSAENDGYLVPYREISNALSWVYLLAPYVTGRDFTWDKNQWIRCPALKLRDPANFVVSGIGPVFTRPNSSLHLLHSQPEGPGNVPVSKKAAAVAKPALTPSWMDVCGGSSAGYPVYCPGCYVAGISGGTGITQKNNIGSRHNGSANVGFVDGHVEQVPLETISAKPEPGGPDFFQHYGTP